MFGFGNAIEVGNSASCFRGRCLVGPGKKNLLFSTVLLVVPTVVFCCTVAVELGIAIIVVGALLGAISLSAMYATAFTDPGIVLKEGALSLDQPVSRFENRSLPDGTIVQVKWCYTCRFFRPPRCSHCRICNNCISRFDHHCPYIGQCIGIRNYRFFLCFIFLTSSLCILIFSCSLVLLIRNIERASKEGHSYWDSLGNQIAAIILALDSFVFLWFLGGLSIFHIYLQCKGCTTYERSKRPYGSTNPYNKGCLLNWKEVWLSHIQPSQIISLTRWNNGNQASRGVIESITSQGIMHDGNWAHEDQHDLPPQTTASLDSAFVHSSL